MHDAPSTLLLKELQRRLAEPEMSHRKLELALGLKQNELKGILDTKDPRTPSVEKAKRIAEALGLEFYIGPPRGGAQIAGPDDFAHIPVVDAVLAAGGGAENGSEAIIDHLAFRRSWLSSLGISPSAAQLVRVIGDSMSPTLSAGDMVLVDTGKTGLPDKPRSQRDTRPSPIFALRDGADARIKRIERAEDGGVLLISDNKFHPTERRPLASLTIIGRVMWWGHTNRE